MRQCRQFLRIMVVSCVQIRDWTTTTNAFLWKKTGLKNFFVQDIMQFSTIWVIFCEIAIKDTGSLPKNLLRKNPTVRIKGWEFASRTATWDNFSRMGQSQNHPKDDPKVIYRFLQSGCCAVFERSLEVVWRPGEEEKLKLASKRGK